MNYKAIDAGVNALHEVKVPAEWAEAVAENKTAERTGRPATVKMVNELLDPIGLMDGDSLPVSAFKDIADGQFETGASAYEKRGTAVMVPEWSPEACIQCNSCAFVCSHATIRPFILNQAEVAAAPENIKLSDAKHAAADGMKFTMSVSPLDCMGCGECVTVCPMAAKGALKMVPRESQEAEQPVFNYLVENVGKKELKPAFTDKTPIGSQYNQPLLEFSGSCAGCAETSYARLITQLLVSRCIYPMRQAVHQSGEVRQLHRHIRLTRIPRRVRLGLIHCSRTMRSTALVCILDRRHLESRLWRS